MIALMLAALFQSAAPASSASPPSAPPAKVTKLQCRKETVVGSTIKKKVCPRRAPESADQGESAEAAQVAEAK